MNFFSSHQSRRDEVQLFLEKRLPDVNFDEPNWDTLLAVADFRLANLGDDDLMENISKWVIWKGQRILSNHIYTMDANEVPYSIYEIIFAICDWEIQASAYRDMPKEYLEKYLLNSFCNERELNKTPILKAITKRTDEYGIYPVEWLMKVYGNNNG